MEKIYLWQDEKIVTKADRPSITVMPVGDGQFHPAVLVIPGGAYAGVCEHSEGSPIGREFNKLGYHAFILDYRTAPESRWPEPQQDAMRAMKMIRANAEKWLVHADRVASCGFSAGGHLAGALGVICTEIDASAGDECDKYSHIPDAMILCYGVLSFKKWSNCWTAENLTGSDDEDYWKKFSLPENVTENTPPAFLMHTICDQAVPYRNSMEFADAMAKANVPCELALYYWGAHGMLLGQDTLDVVNWPRQAKDFMESLWLKENDPGFLERYTNAYQIRAEQGM